MILHLHCSYYNTVTVLLLEKLQCKPRPPFPSPPHLLLHSYRQKSFSGRIVNHCTSQVTSCPITPPPMTNNTRKSCIKTAESRPTTASENHHRPSPGRPAPAAPQLPGARRCPLSPQPRGVPVQRELDVTHRSGNEVSHLTAVSANTDRDLPRRLGAPGGRPRPLSSSGPTATGPAATPGRPNPDRPSRPPGRAEPPRGRDGGGITRTLPERAAALLQQSLQLSQPPPPPASASCGRSAPA